MFEEDDGIVIANRGLHEPLGVPGCRRKHHLQPRSVGKPSFVLLRVEGPSMNATSAGRSHHNRYRRVPTVAALGRVIHDLVKSAGDEIGKLDLGDRAQAHETGTNGSSDNSGLRNWRVHNAPFAEVLEHTLRNLECSAV